MEMLDLISSYLLLNRECSIPSLGLLRTVRKSARVDIVNRQMLPPVEEVSFLDEPAISLGGLIDYVARSMNIEPQEASGRLTEFFNNASANIISGGVLEIKQVGSLQKNSEGIIYLNPYNSPGYCLPVAANAVIRANPD